MKPDEWRRRRYLFPLCRAETAVEQHLRIEKAACEREELAAELFRQDVHEPLKRYLELMKAGEVPGPLCCEEGRFWIKGRTYYTVVTIKEIRETVLKHDGLDWLVPKRAAGAVR